MPARKYKNTSDQPQTVIGLGEVLPNAIVSVDFPFSNPNFTEVVSSKKAVTPQAKKGVTK